MEEARVCLKSHGRVCVVSEMAEAVRTLYGSGIVPFTLSLILELSLASWRTFVHQHGGAAGPDRLAARPAGNSLDLEGTRPRVPEEQTWAVTLSSYVLASRALVCSRASVVGCGTGSWAGCIPPRMGFDSAFGMRGMNIDPHRLSTMTVDARK